MSKANIASNRLTYIILAIIAAFACPIGGKALPLSTYAENSVLAQGRWVKISVAESGVYMLSNSTIRSMGFSDPSKVNIYGYGAERLPDDFSSYTDDLPMVQTLRTNRGLIFYAQGPKKLNGLKPVNNPFTTKGYYFVSDIAADAAREIPLEEAKVPAGVTPTKSYRKVIVHEQDIDGAGQTGHELLGEDFLYTTRRTFNFNLSGKCSDDVSVEFVFCTHSATEKSGPSNLTTKVNGATLSSNVIEKYFGDHSHYKETKISKTTKSESDKLAVEISVGNQNTLSRASLNYLSVGYECSLAVPASGSVSFDAAAAAASISGAGDDTHIWDTTDPMSITEYSGSKSGSDIAWATQRGREYVAFKEGAALPSPANEGVVANQNLHSVEVPDMVIFTISNWADQAKRLANYRAENGDSLKVLVVDQNLVFNEFASGAHDVNAFRKFLKMLWDRSQASGSDAEAQLKYALFMGRTLYDNRQILSSTKALGYPLMPGWQSDKSTNDTESYTTDDIFAFLSDSKTSFGSQTYCISVGRLPVTSKSSAKAAVDKIIEYETKMPRTGWRNQFLVVADDKNLGVHMEQADSLYRNIVASNGGKDISYNKIYIDQYELQGGNYPKARELMFRALDEGVAWWTYIGHANTTSLTAENILNYTDINTLYLKHWPIMYAACCDFLRWDANDLSAAEIMWALPSGGAIAVLSAVRPTYISENGKFSKSLGKFIFGRDQNGKRLTVGEIIKRTKNDLKSNSNKLRYVLIGDPSMYPIVPDNKLVITNIAGTELGSDQPAELMARQKTTIEGYVADANGDIITDYNGTVSSTIYDSEYSVTTIGHCTPGEETPDGKPYTFTQQGDRIFAGNDSIVNGRFTVNVAMPSTITNNYLPAAISLSAASDNPKLYADAIGMNRDFYVFGEDFSVNDTIAPVIRTAYLNHPSFKDGDAVNNAPMLIAEISDNSGLNISTAGIGHQMTLLLDNKKNYNDVSQFFTPSASEPGAGTIAYPLSNLTEGEHTLRIRVWDTYDNSAVRDITFNVVNGQAPVLYDVYTDANPASTSANFYLTHDRPDSQIEVTITIYNLLGKPIWSSTSSGRSDMYLSFPIQWNLTDNNGRRVQRGIYLYRASIKAGDEESATKTKRIAVTG